MKQHTNRETDSKISTVVRALTLKKAAVLIPLLAITLVGIVTVQRDETHAQADAPGKPTGLIASSVTHESVTLSWDDPSDDSITGYRILRRDTVKFSKGTFITIEYNTGSAETTYEDSTVEPEGRFAYRVQALNANGASGSSGFVTVDIPAKPVDPENPVPAAPTGLTAEIVTHNSVTLNWDDATDTTITGYQILRRDRDNQAPGVFSTVAENTESADTAFTDTTIAAETNYVYRVKAVNANGLSPQSNYARATTLAAPITRRFSVRQSDNYEVLQQNLDPLTVSFGAASYSAEEGGSVNVVVNIDPAPSDQVVIPLAVSMREGASTADYSLGSQSVAFESGQTSKSVLFSATSDNEDDDGEYVHIAFGAVPSHVTSGEIAETVVNIVTTPVLVSATTRGDGLYVILTFSEEIKPAPFLVEWADSYTNLYNGIGRFMKYVFTVMVDGHDVPLMWVEHSGRTVRIRLETPTIGRGDVVTVAYNNIFAQDPGDALIDLYDTPVPLFGAQAVTNTSSTRRDDFVAPPINDVAELKICEGQTGQYRVKLAERPNRNVGISNFAIPYYGIIVKPHWLTFTPDNWDEYRTINVRATLLEDYKWMPDHLQVAWALSGFRISGIELDQSWEIYVRIAVLGSDRPECQ